MKEKENFGDSVIPICRVPLITSQKEEQVRVLSPVWPEKNRQMSIKLPKNDFTTKMIDFNNFTKVA